MKLNISYPSNGTSITTEITGNDERLLYGKSLGDVIDAGLFNQEYSGWKIQFTGGSDKQGFPMDIKLNTDKRQRLLRNKGDIGYKPRKKGERKRKSVRGAVISEETAVLCMKVINSAFDDFENKKISNEPKHIPKLTDEIRECSHWPRRLSKWKRLLFKNEENLTNQNLTVEMIKEKVRSLVVEEGKKKMPRIRVTGIRSPYFEERLNKRIEEKKMRKERSDKIYNEFMAKYPDWKVAGKE